MVRRAIVLAWFVLASTVLLGHWVNDRAMEDGAWIWSCHTMGNHECVPGQPWLKIQIGGAD